MCVGIRVHTGTHIRCTDGVFKCEPSSRKRPLEGLKNPDGLNVGIYVFVYVYKAGSHQERLVWPPWAQQCGLSNSTHVYIYANLIEEAGGDHGLTAFYVSKSCIFFQERCKCKPLISRIQEKIRRYRVCSKATKRFVTK